MLIFATVVCYILAALIYYEKNKEKQRKENNQMGIQMMQVQMPMKLKQKCLVDFILGEKINAFLVGQMANQCQKRQGIPSEIKSCIMKVLETNQDLYKYQNA